MRALIALAAVAAAVAVTGCYHDKYGLSGPKREEYVLPPDQKRYNEPDTATWKPPPPPKQQDTLMNKAGLGGPTPPVRGGGPGGF
jgi:hypothetical protein